MGAINTQERRDFKLMLDQGGTPTAPGVAQAITFTGAGLNDATAGGTYTATAMNTYTVVIDGTGSPNTFKWKKNAGAFTTGVAITGSAQNLTDGVQITFGATTGHTVDNQWVISMTPWVKMWMDSTGWLQITRNDGSTVTPMASSGGSGSFADGSAASPSLAFTADTNTGFYRIGADQIGVATNGTGQVKFFNDGIEILNNGWLTMGGLTSAGAVLAPTGSGGFYLNKGDGSDYGGLDLADLKSLNNSSVQKFNIAPDTPALTLASDSIFGWTAGAANAARDGSIYRVGAASLAVGTGEASGNGTFRAGIFNAVTGFRINDAAASGAFLRGDGTNFVSNTIQDGDLPSAAVTLTGSQVLTNKTLTSPVINVGSDASGDVYYRNGSGAFTRLAKGTDGHVLTLASGLPSWAAVSSGITGSGTTGTIAKFTASGAIGNSLITESGTEVSISGNCTLVVDSMKIGDFAVDGYAGLINRSLGSSSTNYMLLQDPSGLTMVNGASGQGVVIRNANNNVISFVGTSITVTDNTHFVLNTSNGTKFGTATNQKLAFFNSTPVTKPAALTAVDNTAIDSTYGATEEAVLNNVRTRLNDLESRLQSLGLIS